MNKNNLCNNCGKGGHLYTHCKLPIISYGIILFKQSSQGLKYLMIRRKDSFGYIDFIRGKYLHNNIPQIQRSINEMSLSEKERLMVEPFDQLWRKLWGDNGVQHRSECSLLAKKFDSIRNGLVIGDKTVYLADLIECSNTAWTETEWEFPKGHRNFQEKDIDTALREFEEETGYSKDNITVIDNIIPYEEIFIGSNHKSYKHKYYVAYLNPEQEEDELAADFLQNYQQSEVSKLEWKTLDECLTSIRPYNLEKKNIIKHVNHVLMNYILSY